MSRTKQKRTYYSDEFKRQALERMKASANIVELARELGVARALLYQWEAAAEGRGRAAKRKRRRPPRSEPEKVRDPELQQEIEWLRVALVQKVKEVDFFKGALQKIEERRRRDNANGATESSSKSGQ